MSPGCLLYDCGYNLTADGEYRWAHTAQAHRGALNLHSLHLLLWVNFGAFCLSLLTQPGAQDVIKGRKMRQTCKNVDADGMRCQVILFPNWSLYVTTVFLSCKQCGC